MTDSARPAARTAAVVIFWPKLRSTHPENYLFLLSIKIFSGSKYPKNILFNFEKGSTGWLHAQKYRVECGRSESGCGHVLMRMCHLDRTIPEYAEAVYWLTPSLVIHRGKASVDGAAADGLCEAFSTVGCMRRSIALSADGAIPAADMYAFRSLTTSDHCEGVSGFDGWKNRSLTASPVARSISAELDSERLCIVPAPRLRSVVAPRRSRPPVVPRS